MLSDQLDSIKHERKEKMNASKQLIDTLETIMTELKLRIEDKKKEAFDFKREVVDGDKDAQRWVLNKVNRRDTHSEKLKIQSLRSYKLKLEKLLREREGGNASTHYIEFHQLEIENKNIASDLQRKTKEFIAIKINALQQTSANDLLKTALERLMKNKEVVEKQITTRKNRAMKAGLDMTKIMSEIKVEEAILKENIVAHAPCAPPHSSNYIHRNAELYEVKSQLKTWRRRIDILQKTAPNKRNTSALPDNR